VSVLSPDLTAWRFVHGTPAPTWCATRWSSFGPQEVAASSRPVK